MRFRVLDTIVLDKDLPEHGLQRGDLGAVVRVKDGYARNFLIPQRMARRATAEAIAEFEAKRAELEKAAAAKQAFEPQAERIAEAFRNDFHVVAPDLRGHGDSDWAIGSQYGVPDLFTLRIVTRTDVP